MTDASADVSCTARLHLGFLDLTGDPARRFGSLGLSLDAPGTRLTLRRAPAGTETVQGAEPERAAKMLARLRDALGLPAGHALTVHEAVPAHAGLGSGTQLALAIGAALRRVHGLPPDAAADAARLGRGARSGIGIATFARGGLVVDGGVGRSGALPPLLARCAVPDSWRVVLVMDRTAAGLSGEHERAGFAALPPMAPAQSAELCRLVLLRLLPAVAEDDLETFGAALTAMQAILGAHFAPAQGGSFTSARVESALAVLRAAGAVGIGQSSWGPTGFAFLRGDDAAARAAAQAQVACPGLDFMVRRALNRGADVVGTG